MDVLDKTRPRIFLWSLPRTGSTALAKCMSFADGVQVWMEPYNLSATNAMLKDVSIMAKSPGMRNLAQKFGEAQHRVATGQSHFTGGKLSPVSSFNFDWVQSELEKETEEGKPVQFIKDLSLGIDGHYDKLPKNVPTIHTFLIRHPYNFVPAVRNHIMNIFGYQGDSTEFDVSVANPFLQERDQLHQLWKHVTEGRGPPAIVIDTDELLSYPEVILPKYFRALQIPWHNKYLTWDAGDSIVKTWRGAVEHIEWGMSNKVFDSAFASSCFQKSKSCTSPARDGLTKDVLKYVDIFMPGYLEMYETRIKSTD